MRKKVLVLTLALVLAFASSALAEVKFGGNFTFTFEQNHFQFFKEGFKLTAGRNFNINLTGKSVREEVVEMQDVFYADRPVLDEDGEETGVFESGTESVEVVVLEEHVNWTFSAALDKDFALSTYQLSLFDQYFTAHLWKGAGRGSKKATPFAFVAAAAGGNANRARVIVPVVDLATVTVDLTAEDTLRAFVDGEVEGFNVGLAYQGTGWKEELKNTIAVHGSGSVSDVNVKAEAGFKPGKDLGYAFAIGADTAITDELEIDGSIKHYNDKWSEGKTILGFGAEYTEQDFQVTGDAGYTFFADKDADSENSLEFGAKYRFGQAVGFDNLFNRDTRFGAVYYNLDAPAVGVAIEFANLGHKEGGFDNVRVDVAAPLMEDFAWGHAYLKYSGEKDDKQDFEANALAHIVATDKLTIEPAFVFQNIGRVVDLKLGASYKIGYSDTTLGLTVQKVFVDEDYDFGKDDDGASLSPAKSLIKATVTVPF